MSRLNIRQDATIIYIDLDQVMSVNTSPPRICRQISNLEYYRLLDLYLCK
jgi:hypothetical protein